MVGDCFSASYIDDEHFIVTGGFIKFRIKLILRPVIMRIFKKSPCYGVRAFITILT